MELLAYVGGLIMGGSSSKEENIAKEIGNDNVVCTLLEHGYERYGILICKCEKPFIVTKVEPKNVIIFQSNLQNSLFLIIIKFSGNISKITLSLQAIIKDNERENFDTTLFIKNPDKKYYFIKETSTEQNNINLRIISNYNSFLHLIYTLNEKVIKNECKFEDLIFAIIEQISDHNDEKIFCVERLFSTLSNGSKNYSLLEKIRPFIEGNEKLSKFLFEILQNDFIDNVDLNYHSKFIVEYLASCEVESLFNLLLILYGKNDRVNLIIISKLVKFFQNNYFKYLERELQSNQDRNVIEIYCEAIPEKYNPDYQKLDANGLLIFIFLINLYKLI